MLNFFDKKKGKEKNPEKEAGRRKRNKKYTEHEITKLREKALKLSDPKCRDYQFKLGEINEDGNELIEAYKWYEMAAQRKHEEALVRVAQFLLSDIEGIEKDTALALGYLESAVKIYDNFKARFNLADIFIYGLHGVSHDLEKAEGLIKDLANKGNDMARLRMGRIYEVKFELDRDDYDFKEAVKYYRIAARSQVELVKQKALDGLQRLGAVQMDRTNSGLLTEKRKSSILGHSESDGVLIQQDEIVFEKGNKKALGKGLTAEIKLAKYRGRDVAVKALVQEKCAPEDWDAFKREIEIFKKLDNKNIAMCYGIWPGKDQNSPSIVMEYVKNSLDKILYDREIALSWEDLFEIARGISFGLAYLHKHKPPILHRDLKSSNVLLTEEWIPKIIDFGISRFKAQDMTRYSIGTPQWMAPELLATPPDYSEKSDVYALGIIFWELAARDVPYSDSNFKGALDIENYVKEGKRLRIPEDCPQAFKKLIEMCWMHESSERPTAKGIVKYLNRHRNEIINHDDLSTKPKVNFGL